MNSLEARQILLAWRPDRGDSHDPQVAEALTLVEKVPALKQWLEGHKAYQQTLARTFHDIPVPGDLRTRILAHSKIVRPALWWQRPAWLASAAAVLLLLSLAVWWLRPVSEYSLDTFRSRMVTTVLRQYSMDIVTNDMTQVRTFLAGSKAPSDYVLPDKLSRLPVAGAGVLSWRDQRVSMICLDSPTNGTLFLFVVESASLGQPPPTQHDFQQVNKLMTVSWTEGQRTYVLAGNGGRQALEQHF